MPTDHVMLTVPAKDEYAKAARMTAASLVSRMDMSYDDLDDVKTATEEAFIYACDAEPASGEVTLHFFVDDDALRIEVPISPGSRTWSEDADARSALTTFILQGVCDSYEMSSDESGAWLRLLKRFGPVSVDAD
jgi:anti-sigma regulatory factor (Ser/Thr protein kinase)